MRKTVVSLMLLVLSANLAVYGQQHPKQRMPFVTDTPMVHDPVMAYEDGSRILL